MQTSNQMQMQDRGMARVELEGDWELELHPQGGLLLGRGVAELRPDDKLAVELHLSAGARVTFSARVRSLEITASGDPGAWIEFVDLDIAERQEFRRWRESVRRERGASKVAVSVKRQGNSQGEGGLAEWVNRRLEAARGRGTRALEDYWRRDARVQRCRA